VNKIFEDKSLVVVFAYASAGLGHLRVTDALYHGLPENLSPLLLRTQDQSVSFFHRLTSISLIGRFIGEAMQKGILERIITKIYSAQLRSTSDILYKQMLTILDQRISVPKKLLVIATHFGLAHQLAAVKQKLEQKYGIKVYLVVQVTDDSPQRMWDVKGADLIVVPSRKTKRLLKSKALKAVSPYPINPSFAFGLEKFKSENKAAQVGKGNSKIHICIPVSGAAVGLNYIKNLITALHESEKRYYFHIVARQNLYTKTFLEWAEKQDYIQALSSIQDREVVNLYEQVYLNNIISLEITKPSEQCFKAILDPTRVGGSVLLLTHPVGRQEYDNLDFLYRHKLIPNKLERDLLWESNINEKLASKAKHWRGLRLPDNPKKAADFILWCKEQSLFLQMMQFSRPVYKWQKNAYEVRSDGVSLFWKKVATLITRA